MGSAHVGGAPVGSAPVGSSPVGSALGASSGAKLPRIKLTNSEPLCIPRTPRITGKRERTPSPDSDEPLWRRRIKHRQAQENFGTGARGRSG